MKTIIATLPLLFSAGAQAAASTGLDEQFKPVYCAPFASLLEELEKTPHNETASWTAQDGTTDSRYVLFINYKSGNWTLLQVWKTTGCILGSGSGSQIISKNKGPNT